MAQNIILLVIFFFSFQPFKSAETICSSWTVQKQAHWLWLTAVAHRLPWRVFYAGYPGLCGPLPALSSPLPLPSSPSPLYTSHHLPVLPSHPTHHQQGPQILSAFTVVVPFRGKLSVISSGKRHRGQFFLHTLIQEAASPHQQLTRALCSWSGVGSKPNRCL